jgi:hypothetical protein
LIFDLTVFTLKLTFTIEITVSLGAIFDYLAFAFMQMKGMFMDAVSALLQAWKLAGTFLRRPVVVNSPHARAGLMYEI